MNPPSSNTKASIILVYHIKDTAQYAIYDVYPWDIVPARKRLEEKHPEYTFLGHEVMADAEEAKAISRAFNKAMATYVLITTKYPLS